VALYPYLLTRVFVYVRDVAEANVAALESTFNGVFNISSCKQTTINNLLEIINEIVCKNITPTYCSSRDGDIVHSYLNKELAISTLGWSPRYGLRTGLDELIRFVLENRTQLIV